MPTERVSTSSRFVAVTATPCTTSVRGTDRRALNRDRSMGGRSTGVIVMSMRLPPTISSRMSSIASSSGLFTTDPSVASMNWALPNPRTESIRSSTSPCGGSNRNRPLAASMPGACASTVISAPSPKSASVVLSITATPAAPPPVRSTAPERAPVIRSISLSESAETSTLPVADRTAPLAMAARVVTSRV